MTTIAKERQDLKRTIFYIILWIASAFFASWFLIHRYDSKFPKKETISAESHFLYVDSMETIVEGKLQIIDSLAKIKSEVKTKYKKYYVYIEKDSNIFDELLFEYGLLDDTIVPLEGDNLIEYRLLQGLESFADNKINDIQEKQYISIIEDLQEIIKNDSIQIAILVDENNKCVLAYNKLSDEVLLLSDRIASLEGKSAKNRFKMAFAFGDGAIVGFLVGLSAK